VKIADDWRCPECTLQQEEHDYALPELRTLTFRSSEMRNIKQTSITLPNPPFAGRCTGLEDSHWGLPCICIGAVSHFLGSPVHQAMFHSHWDRVNLMDALSNTTCFIGNKTHPSLDDRTLADESGSLIDAEPYQIAADPTTLLSLGDGGQHQMVLTLEQVQIFEAEQQESEREEGSVLVTLANGEQRYLTLTNEQLQLQKHLLTKDQLPEEPVLKKSRGRPPSRNLRVRASRDGQRGRTSLTDTELKRIEANIAREIQTVWPLILFCICHLLLIHVSINQVE